MSRTDRVVAVYADGGCIQSNPSPIGATWAWCHVDARGQRVATGSGVVTPADISSHARNTTNNQSEFYALLSAMEALPDGWSGRACSDSSVTLRRFFRQGSLRGIPHEWCTRLGQLLRRLDRIEVVALKGHPSKRELLAGVARGGLPVSEHNVWCDRACADAGHRFLAGPEPIRLTFHQQAVS